jgi:CRISPR-associated protein (TIGR03984 family)
MLVYESRTDVSLEVALAEIHVAVELTGAMALLAAPDRYSVGRIEPNEGEPRPVDARGRALDLDGVFDARVFTPQLELRWTRGESGGRALLVSEGGAGPAGWERLELEAEPLEATTYLLLGEVERPTPGPGWTRLTSGRAGAIELPITTQGQRLLLRAVEYVAVDQEHGNAYICEERLLGLTPAPEPGHNRPRGSEP